MTGWHKGGGDGRGPRGRVPTKATAREIALEALLFLAAEPDRMMAFLAATGTTPSALRAASGEDGTLRAVLEYLLADESLLLVFAANGGHAPPSVEAARAALEGP